MSRQTRLEALPLFYSRCRFRFKIYNDYYGPDRDAEAFIRNTPAHNFTRIRFLELSCLNCQDPYLTYIAISVSLNDHDCSMKVSDFSYWGNGEHKKVILNRLARLLVLEPHTFIRGIAAREGPMKLQKNDILVLCNKLKGAVLQALGRGIHVSSC